MQDLANTVHLDEGIPFTPFTPFNALVNSIQYVYICIKTQISLKP